MPANGILTESHVYFQGTAPLRRVQRKILSTDPRRRAILCRLRWIGRHLPRQGRLLFFDVQPIVVKAYGGRRYTRAKQRVLAQAQKTRGRCYLFALYDVKDGCVRWGFFPGKGSVYVCQFMQRVRGWYPDAEVFIPKECLAE